MYPSDDFQGQPSNDYEEWVQAPVGRNALETVRPLQVEEAERNMKVLRPKLDDLFKAAVADVGQGFPRQRFGQAARKKRTNADEWSEDEEGPGFDALAYAPGKRKEKKEKRNAFIEWLFPERPPPPVPVRAVPLFQQYHKIFQDIKEVRRPPSSQKWNCMLQQLFDGKKECENFACHGSNCNAIAFRIIHDYNRRENPALPLHEDSAEPRFYRVPIPVEFLRSEQVHAFFFQEEDFSGLLGVHEYCDNLCDPILKKTNGTCAALEWNHVYLIERHREKCAIMQGDEDLFQLYHFMGGKKSQLPKRQRNFAQLQKLKRILGYDRDGTAEGVDCLELYKRYQKVYLKLSYIHEFKGQCHDYWWNYRERGNVSIDLDYTAWHWVSYAHCFDEVEHEPHPGTFIKKELLDINPKRLGPSLSGSGNKCVALPFKPSSKEAHAYFGAEDA